MFDTALDRIKGQYLSVFLYFLLSRNLLSSQTSPLLSGISLISRGHGTAVPCGPEWKGE